MLVLVTLYFVLLALMLFIGVAIGEHLDRRYAKKILMEVIRELKKN